MMMATRMNMMATRQPIRMRVLLSSTLWVGSSSGERREAKKHVFSFSAIQNSMDTIYRYYDAIFFSPLLTASYKEFQLPVLY